MIFDGLTQRLWAWIRSEQTMHGTMWFLKSSQFIIMVVYCIWIFVINYKPNRYFNDFNIISYVLIAFPLVVLYARNIFIVAFGFLYSAFLVYQLYHMIIFYYLVREKQLYVDLVFSYSAWVPADIVFLILMFIDVVFLKSRRK